MNLNIHAHAIRSINVTTLRGRGSHPFIKLLIMKLIILLTIGFSLHVSANALGQGITLSVKEASFKNVLQSIQRQSGYSFLIRNDQIQQAHPVTLDIKSKDITDVLPILFNKQPFSYEVDGRLIKVVSKSSSNPKPTEQLQITIRGRVTDSLGNPLAGVTVQVKESGWQTMTDREGRYELTGVYPTETLHFRLLSYEPFEASANRPEINVTMRFAYSKLDETIVIAYGTSSRRLSTGNISKVSEKTIAEQSVNNPLQAIVGRVPGIALRQSNGLPGSNISVRVQGLNSIANGNEPFYVIDGVPYNSNAISSVAPIFGSGISPLSFLSPSMIESIEILKDADATAIYGSRAANGAILITTKKGKPGHSKFELRLQNGWGEVSNYIELLNTQEYLQLRHLALENDGLSPGTTDYDVNGVWNGDRYTDWQKELVGGTAGYQDIDASFTAGDIYTQFRVNGTFHRETTVFPGNQSDKKGNVHTNITHKSRNNRFRFQFTGSFLNDNSSLINSDLYSRAVTLAPNAPELYSNTGELNWEVLPNGAGTWDNPLQFLLQPYYNKTTNLISNINSEFEIYRGISVGASFGYNRLNSRQRTNTPMSAYRPDLRQYVQRLSFRSEDEISSWIFEPTINYKNQWKDLRFNAILGATFQSNNNENVGILAMGFQNDEQLDNLQSASSLIVTNSSMAAYRYAAAFSRLNVLFKDRYIVNLSARTDGSSRFGPENKFNSFYAVGAAWIFSEEIWIKNNIPWMSFGKIKSSYGVIGSDQIGDYTFLNLYGTYNVGIPYQGVSSLTPIGHFNPYLQWEETKKFNIGIDFSVFNESIALSANYFINRSSNQVIGTQLPFLTGFNSIRTNLPAIVENSGLEISADIIPLKLGKFRWSLDFNLTLPENKLVSFPNLQDNPSYNRLLEIGKPIGIQRAYKFHRVNPEIGQYEFINRSGEITTSPSFSNDRISIIDLSPSMYGGINNSFSYKGFELGFLIQFVNQKAKDYRYGNFPGFNNANQPASILGNYWINSGDETYMQKISTMSNSSLSAIASSDAAYTDASFIRLKNASLRWSIPDDWCSYLRFQNGSVFASGQNLFTISQYDLDPETLSAVALPTLRIMSLGILIGF